jgi:hypothetical protein
MNTKIVDMFKAAYQNLGNTDLSQLDALYDSNVVFKDPVHEIRGLANMQDYMENVCANVEECKFEFLDQLYSDEAAYIKWDMYFRHPKLASGELLKVRGVSQIYYNDRIYYHEDFYDLGAMVYEQIPLLSLLTKLLKKRLAS